MNQHTQVAYAGFLAGVGLLAVLGLSLVFPALGSPLALGIGAAAGFVLAVRDQLPPESPSFRAALAYLAIASAALIWLNLQPGYIGI